MKTYCEIRQANWYLSVNFVNPVQRRILELASFQPGHRKIQIREVRRKVVFPNRRYSWKMFEHLADTEPVDTVVMDVDLDQAIEIDRKVAETLRQILPSTSLEHRPDPVQERRAG